MQRVYITSQVSTSFRLKRPTRLSTFFQWAFAKIRPRQENLRTLSVTLRRFSLIGKERKTLMPSFSSESSLKKPDSTGVTSPSTKETADSWHHILRPQFFENRSSKL